MKFDRSAPGRGVEVECRLENGKAFLEWRFHLTDAYSRTEDPYPQASRLQDLHLQASHPQDPHPQASRLQVPQSPFLRSGAEGGRNDPACSQPVICISLMAGEGNMAAQGIQTAGEEEPLETVLVQPRLWQGIKDPFRYDVEAVLLRHGVCLDRLCRQLCLRRLEAGGEGELILNGQPLEIRAVAYSLPCAGSGAERQSQAVSDFRQLVQLGANCVCIDPREHSQFLLDLCDRFGFLALERYGAEGGETDAFVCAQNRAVRVHLAGEGKEEREGAGEKVPVYRDGPEALFLPHRKCPASNYYKYKAKWSKEPFVYLVPESVRKLKSGNYTVTCYSSCGRVALYTDGELFEFRKGDGEFVFQEIPVRTPCIMLSAEGDGCSGALSVHKSFVKA